MPIEQQPLSEKTARQFDLLSLFEWTLLVGLFFAVLAGGNEYIVGFEFSALPPNDQALRQWLVDEAGLRDAIIKRDRNEVTVRTQRMMLWWTHPFPQPPWNTLGYTGLKSQSMEYRATMFKAPLVIGFLMVLACSAFRKWQQHRSTAAEDESARASRDRSRRRDPA